MNATTTVRQFTSDDWRRESAAGAASCQQIEMDKLSLLYELACKYSISDADSRRLCDVAGLSYQQLLETI